MELCACANSHRRIDDVRPKSAFRSTFCNTPGSGFDSVFIATVRNNTVDGFFNFIPHERDQYHSYVACPCTCTCHANASAAIIKETRFDEYCESEKSPWHQRRCLHSPRRQCRSRNGDCTFARSCGGSQVAKFNTQESYRKKLTTTWIV